MRAGIIVHLSGWAVALIALVTTEAGADFRSLLAGFGVGLIWVGIIHIIRTRPKGERP